MRHVVLAYLLAYSLDQLFVLQLVSAFLELEV